jgi:hypothetical protein
VAEDVAKVNPDLVVRDATRELYSVHYEAINTMLLNASLLLRSAKAPAARPVLIYFFEHFSYAGN